MAGELTTRRLVRGSFLSLWVIPAVQRLEDVKAEHVRMYVNGHKLGGRIWLERDRRERGSLRFRLCHHDVVYGEKYVLAAAKEALAAIGLGLYKPHWWKAVQRLAGGRVKVGGQQFTVGQLVTAMQSKIKKKPKRQPEQLETKRKDLLL